MPEPPGSLIRHNALVGLHSHTEAPAPASAPLHGPASTPHIAPAPALAAPAPGKLPGVSLQDKAREARGYACIRPHAEASILHNIQYVQCHVNAAQWHV